MKTDCPNCSFLIEGEFSPGNAVFCPFCGETFEFCVSPFEQLRTFMMNHWPVIEYGPFRDYGYPRKNYTGWIIHRLREDNRAAVIDLMAQFLVDREYAAESVNSLWSFDFSPYLSADPETVEELRALWIRVRFTDHARPERQNISALLRTALWTRQISLTPDWIGKTLTVFEEERQQLDPEDREETEQVTEADLIVAHPQGNPLFDWAVQAPVAIRERLHNALLMCNFGSSGDKTQPYSYLFKLDRAQNDRWGADCGYASRCLFESNIFTGPLPETYNKLFSKEELSAFLAEHGVGSKPSYSRQKMLDLLLVQPGGTDWLEEKIKAKMFVRLHPALARYLDEIHEDFRKGWHFYDAMAMIPVPAGRTAHEA